MPLVVAEGIEHRNRFIPAIEKLMRDFCDQKTWVLPAHDTSLKVFHGEEMNIELFSSGLACNLATAVWLLDDELSDDVKKLVDANVRRRILDPFADMMLGKRTMNGWLTVNNNWNSVCLCNVIGAALASLPSREDRALYLAGADEYSESYLAGFDDDGYCVEGMGYWNYGFGNYIRLCELAWQSSGGKLNWFDRPKVAEIASYPKRFELTHGIYPSFGDTQINSTPTQALMAFVSGEASDGFLSNGVGGGLSETMMFSCPNSARDHFGSTKDATRSLRDWFDDAKVLICRPAKPSADALAVAIKAGHNGVSHGHDDLGSFVVTVGNSVLLADPGREVYTARTFSKDRYVSKVLNSFGHSVPIVDDVLQGHTASANADVLRRDFTDTTDTLELDLTRAYPTDDLKSLCRTFIYDRSGGGQLTVNDEVLFRPGKSHRFGITLITFGQFKRVSPNQLQIWDDKAAVQIDLDGSAELKITTESIDEDTRTPTKPLRIAAVMDASTNATVHMTVHAIVR
jgi:hypothetical protein